MATVDRHAPGRFLRTVFEPTDWVAISSSPTKETKWPSASDRCHGYRAIGFSGGSAR